MQENGLPRATTKWVSVSPDFGSLDTPSMAWVSSQMGGWEAEGGCEFSSSSALPSQSLCLWGLGTKDAGSVGQ